MRVLHEIAIVATVLTLASAGPALAGKGGGGGASHSDMQVTKPTNTASPKVQSLSHGTHYKKATIHLNRPTSNKPFDDKNKGNGNNGTPGSKIQGEPTQAGHEKWIE